jgi:hypothetical protein
MSADSRAPAASLSTDDALVNLSTSWDDAALDAAARNRLPRRDGAAGESRTAFLASVTSDGSGRPCPASASIVSADGAANASATTRGVATPGASTTSVWGTRSAARQLPPPAPTAAKYGKAPPTTTDGGLPLSAVALSLHLWGPGSDQDDPVLEEWLASQLRGGDDGGCCDAPPAFTGADTASLVCLPPPMSAVLYAATGCASRTACKGFPGPVPAGHTFGGTARLVTSPSSNPFR